MNDETHVSPFVKLYEVYEDSEYVHMVMELCQLGSLNSLITKHNDDDSLSWNSHSNSENSNSLMSEKFFKKIMR